VQIRNTWVQARSAAMELDRAASVSPAQLLLVLSMRDAEQSDGANVRQHLSDSQWRRGWCSSNGFQLSATADAFCHRGASTTRFRPAFFLAGQLLSNLTIYRIDGTATASSIDGASTVVFGLLNGGRCSAAKACASGRIRPVGFPSRASQCRSERAERDGCYLYTAMIRQQRVMPPIGARGDPVIFSRATSTRNQW